jgi:hypothetical protein
MINPLMVLVAVAAVMAPDALTVDIPDSAPELMINPLMVLVAVAAVIAPEALMVDMPDSAPELIINPLIELVDVGAVIAPALDTWNSLNEPTLNKPPLPGLVPPTLTAVPLSYSCPVLSVLEVLNLAT